MVDTWGTNEQGGNMTDDRAGLREAIERVRGYVEGKSRFAAGPSVEGHFQLTGGKVWVYYFEDLRTLLRAAEATLSAPAPVVERPREVQLWLGSCEDRAGANYIRSLERGAQDAGHHLAAAEARNELLREERDRLRADLVATRKRCADIVRERDNWREMAEDSTREVDAWHDRFLAEEAERERDVKGLRAERDRLREAKVERDQLRCSLTDERAARVRASLEVDRVKRERDQHDADAAAWQERAHAAEDERDRLREQVEELTRCHDEHDAHPTNSVGTCRLCGYHGPGPRHECTPRGSRHDR